MRCPRRDEMFALDPEGEDQWIPGRYPCCSYCGSISPESFFAAIEAGKELGPTDKNYKVYVDGTHKFYFQHLDPAGQRRFVELFNAKRLKFDSTGAFYVLPYFVKLESNPEASSGA